MELTLRIPDGTYRTYVGRAARETEKRLETGGRGKVTPESLILNTLTHFASAGDGGRWLLIPPDHRAEVEKLLGGGHITASTKLLERLRQRLAVTLEGVTLKFSDAQHARITKKSERLKKKPGELLQKIIDDVSREFLGRV